MATKRESKENRPTVQTPSSVKDPFASTVETSSPVRTTAKKTASVPRVPSQRVKVQAADAAAKPAARAAKKVAASRIEPFAEIAVPAEGKTIDEVPPRRSSGVSSEKPTAKKKTKAASRSAKVVATSPSKREPERKKPAVVTEVKAEEATASPIFKALADVRLPQLGRHARARLLVQSPTRIYLYWSLKQDPWQQLRAVFGNDVGSYTLVIKLRDLTRGTEEIHPAGPGGEWWFNSVLPDTEYSAEIGFYATNRPYFRVLYSNSVFTPRSSPSSHPATEARWTVSATKFAEVLDASGFTRDAVDVAIAGDDPQSSDARTHMAFAELVGSTDPSLTALPADEVRHTMIAIAGGATLEQLRSEVSPAVFEILQAVDGLNSDAARSILSTHFEIDEEEWMDRELGPAVFGASLVNFSKSLKPRKGVKYAPRYNPVSSFALGR